MIAAVGDLTRGMVGATVPEILERLVYRMVELLPVDGAGATMMSERSTPQPFAASDDVARLIELTQSRLGEGPCVAAYEGGSFCAVPDLTRESPFPAFAANVATAGLGGVFAFPLGHDGERLGAIDLYRRATGPLTDNQIASAESIAQVASALLLNAERRGRLERASEQLESVARLDPLTQLANRRALSERLELAIGRWERSRRPFAVLFLDLDGFKAVNDRHGHTVGDRLLVELAARLQRAVRPADLIARLGGDEFVAVCEDLVRDDEPDPLRARFADALTAPFLVDGTAFELSASIGVAGPEPGIDTPSALLRASDQAMYAAKHASSPTRNPLVDVPPATGEPDAPDDFARDAAGTVAATWRERLIRGGGHDGEVALSSVQWNERTGELLITRYDRRGQLYERREWQPATGRGATGVLTVYDWDDQEVLSRRVESIPDPPTDPASLARAMEEVPPYERGAPGRIEPRPRPRDDDPR